MGNHSASSLLDKRRASKRLPGYNYGASGAYSVTTCTQNRKPILNMPILRNILESNWVLLPQTFAGVKTDSFVIMADHIHFIVWINADIEGSLTLPAIVQSYKSRTTVDWFKYVRQNHLPQNGKLWQPEYHDHIIRNEADLAEKRNYIYNNPIVDKFKRRGFE